MAAARKGYPITFSKEVGIPRLLRLSFYCLAACCVIGVGGLFFVHNEAVAKQLNNWYLIPRPEPLTELYFSDHKALPKLYKAGSDQTISFTIHNLEHQTILYRYSLVATSDDTKTNQVLNEGTLTLAANDTQAVSKTFVVPAISERVNIKVNLEYEGLTLGDNTPSTQTQSIHFWLKVTDLPVGSKGKP